MTMDDYALAIVVEGHGDARAVPELVRKYCYRFDLVELEMNAEDVLRVHRDTLIDEFETHVELAARKVSNRAGRILVVFDADDDCPAELGPELAERAQQARGDMPIGIVLPKYEFENWFVAECGGFLESDPPSRPESIRDAKGWLEQRRGRYRETLHQEELVWDFDLEQALGHNGTAPSRSLVKLGDELNRILRSVD